MPHIRLAAPARWALAGVVVAVGLGAASGCASKPPNDPPPPPQDSGADGPNKMKKINHSRDTEQVRTPATTKSE